MLALGVLSATVGHILNQRPLKQAAQVAVYVLIAVELIPTILVIVLARNRSPCIAMANSTQSEAPEPPPAEAEEPIAVVEARSLAEQEC